MNNKDYSLIYMMGVADGERKASDLGVDGLIKANADLMDEIKLLKYEKQELERIRKNALNYIEKYKMHNAIPLELYEILKDK